MNKHHVSCVFLFFIERRPKNIQNDAYNVNTSCFAAPIE